MPHRRDSGDAHRGANLVKWFATSSVAQGGKGPVKNPPLGQPRLLQEQ